MLLLRLRDGKTRGIKKGGVLDQLTRELIAAAKEEGGYPDSDDEEEEDEEGKSSKTKNSLISRDESDPSTNKTRSTKHEQQQPHYNVGGRRMRMAVFTK